MGIEVVALRYFNVYGPRQDPTSQYAAVVPRFIVACLEGKPPTIYGDGEQSRDFTYVENVVEANLLAAEARGASGGVFNVACGERTTINELFSRIAEVTGRTGLRPRYEEARAGDVKHSVASIDLARRELGFVPKVDLLQGIERTVAFFKKGRG